MNKILGVLLVLITAVGGVGLYEFAEEGVTGRLSHAEYLQLVSELPDDLPVAIIDQSPDRVEIITKSLQCPYSLFRIEHTEVTVKCGYYIVAKFDTQSRYYRISGEDLWVGNFRKRTLTDLSIRPASEGFDIVLSQPYYRGRTGSGGTLNTIFTVTKDKIKISQVYPNPSKTLVFCAGIRIKRLEEDRAWFLPNDASFAEKEDDTYWYCSEKGEDLISDPVVVVDSAVGLVEVGLALVTYTFSSKVIVAINQQPHLSFDLIRL